MNRRQTRHAHTRVCGIASAVIALVTLAANAQETDDSSWPQWLDDAMAQEDLDMRIRKIELDEGRIQTRLAGKPAAEPQAIDGGWYLPRDIDTGTPLECWAFTSIVDPATMANRIAEQSMAASAKLGGPLGERQLFFLDAGAIDGAP